MSRRFQFSLKWLFVAMLAVACFFGGIRFERERRRREDEAAAEAGQKSLYHLQFARGPMWADEIDSSGDSQQSTADE